MFSRVAGKAGAYILPTAGLTAGVSTSTYFGNKFKTNNTTTAYAWWGSSSSTPAATTPAPVNPEERPNQQPAALNHPSQRTGGSAPVLEAPSQLVTSPNAKTHFYDQKHTLAPTPMPNTSALLNNIDVASFQSATSPLDRVLLKENVAQLTVGTDISLSDVRSRLERYTETELKDSLSNGDSTVFVSRALEDIKRDKVIHQHTQSPNGYKNLARYMFHSEVLPVNKGVIGEIHICQYQANKEIEDTYCFIRDLHSAKGSVVGVFDGHSGRDSSVYCAKNLVPYLDFFKYYGLSQDFMDPHVIQAADEHYIDLALGDNAFKALTGACLLLAQITNQRIETLWAGDCQAILVRDNAQSHTGLLPQQTTLHTNISNPPTITHTLPVTGTLTNTTGSAGEFTELTVPHQIDLNYYEKQRLINEHPTEHDVIYNDRVKGRLQPTRAFGDAHYKKMAYYKLKYPHKDMTNWNPPYITAKPDHSSYDLHRDDKYVVLCSDGLTDALTPFQISALLHNNEQIQSKLPSAPITTNLAQFLTTQALFQVGKRALGNVATLDEIAQALPSLQPGRERRRIHDDITVLVVKLNGDHIGNTVSDKSPFTPNVKPPVPANLRQAIKNGLLSQKHGLPASTPTGNEFLNTGIVIDPDLVLTTPPMDMNPSKESTF